MQINRNQKGFTLIELLVAVAITAVIGVAIAMALVQTLTINAMSTNHVTVLKQVENAIFWVDEDAQVAQNLQPTMGSGFPLTLSWTEWDNTTHQVIYSLVNNELLRSHSINGGPAQQAVIARHIDDNAANTNCGFASGVFTFRVTSTVGGFKPATETKIAQVVPRSAP